MGLRRSVTAPFTVCPACDPALTPQCSAVQFRTGQCEQSLVCGSWAAVTGNTDHHVCFFDFSKPRRLFVGKVTVRSQPWRCSLQESYHQPMY